MQIVFLCFAIKQLTSTSLLEKIYDVSIDENHDDNIAANDNDSEPGSSPSDPSSSEGHPKSKSFAPRELEYLTF